jgi:hypothetical protein
VKEIIPIMALVPIGSTQSFEINPILANVMMLLGGVITVYWYHWKYVTLPNSRSKNQINLIVDLNTVLKLKVASNGKTEFALIHHGKKTQLGSESFQNFLKKLDMLIHLLESNLDSKNKSWSISFWETQHTIYALEPAGSKFLAVFENGQKVEYFRVLLSLDSLLTWKSILLDAQL